MRSLRCRATILCVTAALLSAPWAHGAPSEASAGGAIPAAGEPPAHPVPRAVRRELDRAEAQLKRSLEALPGDTGVVIVRERERVLLRAPARVLFELDGSALRSDVEATVTLKAAAQLLRQRHRLEAQVRVYSDNIGAASANAMLTAQRAQALVAALSVGGVAAARVSGQGEGAAQPLAANDSPEGRMLNRRVEIAFERSSSSAAPASSAAVPSVRWRLRPVPAAASAGG